MLLVLVPPADETALNRMNEIGAEYKRRFTQDAVLRGDYAGLRRLQVTGPAGLYCVRRDHVSQAFPFPGGQP